METNKIKLMEKAEHGSGFKGHCDEKKSAQIKLSSAAGKIGPAKREQNKKKVSGSAATKGRHRSFSSAHPRRRTTKDAGKAKGVTTWNNAYS